jgi:hypothetical protein
MHQELDFTIDKYFVTIVQTPFIEFHSSSLEVVPTIIFYNATLNNHL